MSDTQPLMFISRPRAITDWKCPRMRYWQYEYLGQGIVVSNTSLDLFIGTVVHDGLAAIARGLDPEQTFKLSHDQMVESLDSILEDQDDAEEFRNEQATLVEGLLRGFYKMVWPNLLMAFPYIVAVEQEMEYHRNQFVFRAKPDLVVRNSEGELFYIEYKTTSTKKDSWINSWNYAVQVHSTIKAIEETLKEPVTSVIVQGLYKGYESYGKQTSPFCYSYFRSGQPPFSKDEFLYEYKAGYRKKAVWEMDGGISKWVDNMPDSVLMEQFPQTPPIFPNNEFIEQFFNQREMRELEIAMANKCLKDADEDGRQEVMNIAFPQKFDQCYPSFGSPCSYRELCFGNVPDPLKAGWELRNNEHELKWGKNA